MDEYITVFEAQEYTTWFSWLYVVALAMGLFTFFWLIKPIWKAVKEEGWGIFRKEKLLILPLLFAIVLSYATVTIAYTGIDDVIAGHSLYNRYKDGKCDYVEGYITDFHPMPKEGHDDERFKVNGVAFSYGGGLPSEYYYNTCKKDGGVLEEGLYVRLWYLNFDHGTEYPISYIMRIDVKRSSISGEQN